MAALNLIVPTAVSVSTGSASILPSGTVTGSAVNTLRIDDCFPSTYTDFLVVGWARSADANNRGFRWYLRSGGSSALTGTYSYQYIDADNTSVSSARATSNSDGYIGNIGDNSSGGSGIYAWFYNVNIAQRSIMWSRNADDIGPKIQDWVSAHKTNTAYDGIELFAVSNFDFQLMFYGLER